MLTRRELMRAGLGAGVAVLSAAALAAPSQRAAPLLRRAIPSSGEQIPVVGVGTNNYSPTTPEERAARREVLSQLALIGGGVIDTAPAYRASEAVIGELLAEFGGRERVFLATKVTAASNDVAEGAAMFEESLLRLRTTRVDLLQVHNLTGAAALLPAIERWKREERVRYGGITTSRSAQYPQMLQLMREARLDFVQVDYSIANRAAADEVLPLARQRGMAVLVNMPFGGRRDGNLFARVTDLSLPGFAADLGIDRWSQFFLKYVLSHPAVTCAIPGTTRRVHFDDNVAAGSGPMPDAALRGRMEQFWDRNFPGAV